MTSRIRPEDVMRPELLAAEPYRVADASGMIKLDAMENPWPMPDAVRRRWLAELERVELNRYPDAAPAALGRLVGGALGMPPDLPVMLGNGSDELIQLLCLAVARPGARAMAPSPGFAIYEIAARLAGLCFAELPMDGGGFRPRAAEWLERIERERPALVFLTSPNNPTGNVLDAGLAERVAEAVPGIVVVDEAYVPYTRFGLGGLASSRHNVLLLRTVSKLGLAGLRLGALAGGTEWIERFEGLRMPYNVNALTQASARVLLDHREWITEQVAAVVRERGRLAERLAALPGVVVYPSEANFVLCRLPAGMASPAYDRLREAGVLVKCLDGGHPALADCLRVTVGRPEENDACLEVLERNLAGQGA